VHIGGGIGICPLFVNEICPSHIQKFLSILVIAGEPCTSIVGAPGIHGVEMAGTHGAGVNTPIAAEVAAITAGLVGAEHIPNDAMLVNGTKSVILALGLPDNITVRVGSTTKGQGVIPKVQVIKAPVVTKVLMGISV
jgi:hypothetical protein